MGVTWLILLLSTLFGCYMKVDAVEIPQVWINYIGQVLRRYEASVASKVTTYFMHIRIRNYPYA